MLKSFDTKFISDKNNEIGTQKLLWHYFDYNHYLLVNSLICGSVCNLTVLFNDVLMQKVVVCHSPIIQV